LLLEQKLADAVLSTLIEWPGSRHGARGVVKRLGAVGDRLARNHEARPSLKRTTFGTTTRRLA